MSVGRGPHATFTQADDTSVPLETLRSYSAFGFSFRIDISMYYLTRLPATKISGLIKRERVKNRAVTDQRFNGGRTGVMGHTASSTVVDRTLQKFHRSRNRQHSRVQPTRNAPNLT